MRTTGIFSWVIFLAFATSGSPGQDKSSTQPTCAQVRSNLKRYLGTKVSLLSVPYVVSQDIIAGKTVRHQMYLCTDAKGSIPADTEAFMVLEGKPTNTTSSKIDKALQSKGVHLVSGRITDYDGVHMTAGYSKRLFRLVDATITLPEAR